MLGLALLSFVYFLSTSALASSEGSDLARDRSNNAQLIQLKFRDGTIITAKLEDQPLIWKTVARSGKITESRINFSDIESLSLTKEPASEAMSAVLKLVKQLDSPIFSQRESAESELRKSGKGFREVFLQADRLATPDGRFRMTRVLNATRTRSSKRNSQLFALDRLTLISGKVLEGDAGKLELNCDYLEKQVSVNRSMLQSIARPSPTKTTRPIDGDKPILVSLFHDQASFSKSGQHRLLEFENNGDGVPLSEHEDISESYTNFGILLGTEFPRGFVGESGYDFAFKDNPTGDNSVCVYKSRAGTQRFQGLMEFTFCEPGKKSISNGVHEFGCFIASVKHSRDILLEAYDAQGRLLGVCESTSEKCSFCGIKSSIPIARLTIRSNPWMLELRKRVDMDFAVDNVYFSKPVPIDSTAVTRHFCGTNGDFIPLSSIRILDDEQIEVRARQLPLLTIDPATANCLRLQTTSRAKPRRSGWMLLRSDNSTLHWDPSNFLYSSTLKKQIDVDDIVAMWPANRTMHFPVAGDFEHGENLLVFPGCRIASNKIELSDKGIRWKTEKVLQEALGEDKVKTLEGKLLPPDNVVPDGTDLKFDDTSRKKFETPTVWLKRPTSITANQGFINTTTGETLVYGDESRMQLKSVSRSGITLSQDGEDIEIPIRDVVSFYPPQPSP